MTSQNYFNTGLLNSSQSYTPTTVAQSQEKRIGGYWFKLHIYEHILTQVSGYKIC